MLTKEQLARRPYCLGASEVSAVACENPFKTPLDVFMRKARGPNQELPPIVVDDQPDPDTCAAFDPFVETDKRTAGSLLEEAIVSLYCHRTGFSVRRSGTIRRKGAPWQTATPDRFVLERQRGRAVRGLEAKLAGRWVRQAWEGVEALPGYVRIQAQWSIHVTGHDVWDVAALVDGTDFRIVRVERDDDLIDDLNEEATEFWRRHVLGNVPPPAVDGDDAYRYVLATHPKARTEAKAAPPQAEAICRELLLTQQVKKEAEQDEKRLKALLCALCGDARAIRGDWGTFSWAEHRGAPLWQEIALRVSPDGAIPQELLDELRGDDYRKAQLHARKLWRDEVLLATEETAA